MKFLFFIAVGLMSISSAISYAASASNLSPEQSTKDSVKITLTIGNKVVPAFLYNTLPARDLVARLPVTVSLNRGPVDYCGGIAPINYVRMMYRQGITAVIWPIGYPDRIL